MKKLFCDICGKETAETWSKTIGNDIKYYLDVEDVCEECNRNYQAGKIGFIKLIDDVTTDAQNKIIDVIKNGQYTLGNKYKGEVI